MGRKVCRRCEGRKTVHLEHCEGLKVLDGNCTCNPENHSPGFIDLGPGVTCPECSGTGERNRTSKGVAP